MVFFLAAYETMVIRGAHVPGLEIRCESASLTRAKTRAKHLTRLPVDSREIFLFFKL